MKPYEIVVDNIEELSKKELNKLIKLIELKKKDTKEAQKKAIAAQKEKYGDYYEATRKYIEVGKFEIKIVGEVLKFRVNGNQLHDLNMADHNLADIIASLGILNLIIEQFPKYHVSSAQVPTYRDQWVVSLSDTRVGKEVDMSITYNFMTGMINLGVYLYENDYSPPDIEICSINDPDFLKKIKSDYNAICKAAKNIDNLLKNFANNYQTISKKKLI